jgi:hypothetical protein
VEQVRYRIFLLGVCKTLTTTVAVGEVSRLGTVVVLLLIPCHIMEFLLQVKEYHCQMISTNLHHFQTLILVLVASVIQVTATSLQNDHLKEEIQLENSLLMTLRNLVVKVMGVDSHL